MGLDCLECHAMTRLTSCQRVGSLCLLGMTCKVIFEEVKSTYLAYLSCLFLSTPGAALLRSRRSRSLSSYDASCRWVVIALTITEGSLDLESAQ